MQKFIKQEVEYLTNKMNYLNSLVEKDLLEKPSFDFNRRKTLKLIKRLFEQEINFLNEDPVSYKDLYNDEHLNN